MIQAIGPTTGSIEAYDPVGRLRARFPTPAAPTYMLEDGDHIIAEYGANGLPQSGGTPTAPPLRRYIFGPGTDEPLVWYEGSTPYWLHADREGSIIAWSDSAGVVTNTASNTNRTLNYGPYGEPSSWTVPRFAYTGQAALPEDQLYFYKARVYSSVLGRFLQTDPVGYDAGLNLYAYVGDDPTNKSDPTGLMPGEWYDSNDRAGDQAVRDINPTSIDQDREYAGRTYQNPITGKFSYTEPHRGSPTQSRPGNTPFGMKPAGRYHTHGSYWGKSPSGIQKDGENFSKADKQGSDEHHEPNYLGTPSGQVEKYTPNGQPLQGKVTVMGNGAVPKDQGMRPLPPPPPCATAAGGCPAP